MDLIGRYEELQLLKKISGQPTPKLVICYGRRRIGKSTLIRTFGRQQSNYIEIQGLAPNSGISKQLVK